MEKKNSTINFLLAVLCAVLFSTSGWMVVWLKESVSASAQLMIRAGVAFVISLVWVLVVDRKISFDFGKYDKRILFLELLCRPLFNFCFIMAAGPQTATVALMILLFVKMLTNVIFTSVKQKSLPGWKEFVGYIAVTAGIVCYGWGSAGILTWSLLWSVGSGALEAIRLELIKKLGVPDGETPKFLVVEFAGMFVVAFVFFLFSGMQFWAVGASGISGHTWIGILLILFSVVIAKLDYFLGSRVPTGIYSAILATEVGFAGVVNFVFLKSPFGLQQIVGVVISIAAIVLIKLATAKKESKN